MYSNDHDQLIARMEMSDNIQRASGSLASKCSFLHILVNLTLVLALCFSWLTAQM